MDADSALRFTRIDGNCAFMFFDLLPPLRRSAALAAAALAVCASQVALAGEDDGSDSGEALRELVIVHTNDFESALDPVAAFWLEGAPRIGGAAHLKTRIDAMRAQESEHGNPLFLLDSGDVFTGLLSRLTYGEVLMEMMITLGYDAMAIGNHEFDYGSVNFLKQANRVPFPVLSANTFHRGTEILYTRPHAILEKNGIRIGVIGVIGEDAASVALPSGITNLEFRDPTPYVRRSVEELRPLVDLIVVLAHQGKTGPMQSDQEVDPEVWRDFEEDIALAGSVPGIDFFLGGHAHRGIDPPYVHPETGTVISQTFGHATRLGVFRIWVDTQKHRMVRWEGGLMTPLTAEYPDDATMAAKIAHYKARHRDDIEPVVGRLARRMTRKYRRESTLGAFVADVIRDVTGADVGLTNAGGLRADLPPGRVTRGHVIDALPFLNTAVAVDMTGAQLVEVLEQGFSLERGMIQASGLRAEIDLERPVGERLIHLEIGGQPLDPETTYRVGTNSFLAEGGDLYVTFLGLPWVVDTEKALSEVVIDFFEAQTTSVPSPTMGRIVRASAAN